MLLHRFIQSALCLSLALASLTPSTASVEPSGGHGAVPLGHGTTVPIRWANDLQATTVDVGIWNADLQQTTWLAENIDANLGQFLWTVPQTQEPGQRYRFVVRDAARHIRAEFSPAWVSIDISDAIVLGGPNEIDHGTDVLLSPLPAADVVTVTWTDRDTEQLQIVDASRRTLAMWPIPQGAGTTQLDLRSIPSGSHFLRVQSRDGRVVVKPLPVLR